MKYEIIKWSLKNGTSFRNLPTELLTTEERAFIDEYSRQRKIVEEPTLRSVAQKLTNELKPNQVRELVEKIKDASDIDLAQYQLYLHDLRFQACQQIVDKISLLKPKDQKDVNDLYERIIELRTANTNKLPQPVNAKNWQSLYDTTEDEMMLDIPWLKDNEVPFKKKVLYSNIATTNGGKTIIKTWTAHEFIKKGYNVLFLAQEEPYVDTIRRIHQATLNLTEDQYKEMTKDGFEKVGTMYNEKAKELGYGEFEVAEWTGATPNDIKQQLREYKKQGLTIDTIVIDYAKLIETNNAQKNAQEWERIGRIFKELKELAMKENVCIVTSIQLNRESSKRMIEKNETPDIYDVAGAYEATMWCQMLLGVIRHDNPLAMQTHPEDRSHDFIRGRFNMQIVKLKHGNLAEGDEHDFQWTESMNLVDPPQQGNLDINDQIANTYDAF